MILRSQSIRLLIVGGVAALAMPVLGIPGLRADGICIKCTGPAATYRCAVQGADVPEDARSKRFYCASRIAEEEHHSACAAVRREKQCTGAQRSYVFDARTPLPNDLRMPQERESSQRRGEAAETDGPPETVEELTRETARRTGESLERAADETVETTRGIGERVRGAASDAAGAVDRAARATFRCIGSLFDEC